MKALVTVPHSGELVPPEANWLSKTDPLTLLTDVDRFVDRLYAKGCAAQDFPMVVMSIHRYVIDLNRVPADIDGGAVDGAPTATGRAAFVSGYHWIKTTQGVVLMPKPISMEQHHALTRKYYEPFHQQVRKIEQELIAKEGLPRFHLDVHSMPSVGTGAHKDSGQARPDVVVSDCSGKSCAPWFKDAVIAAYEAQGFRVAYNWPYLGGRMTEQYGDPKNDRHSVQVELNRALYMDEKTKLPTAKFDETTARLGAALKFLANQSLKSK